MRRFSDFESLIRHVNASLESILPQVATHISKTLKDYVLKNWYRSSKPALYKRTMDILNSIDVSEVRKTTNGHEIVVFFNQEKIGMATSDFDLPSNLPRFNHHVSVNGDMTYDGVSIAEWTVWFMNYGQNSPLHSFSGANFLEDTIKFTETDQKHVNNIKRLLKNFDIDITII